MKGTTMGARARGRVTGIGGIFLRSNSPKRLAKWYRDRLRMEIRSQVVTFEWLTPRRGHRRGATLRAARAPTDRPWGPGRPTAKVIYRVDDLDRLLARLLREGCTVEEKIDESSYGRFGWAIDPDGNRVELWEPPRTRYRSSDRHVPME